MNPPVSQHYWWRSSRKSCSRVCLGLTLVYGCHRLCPFKHGLWLGICHLRVICFYWTIIEFPVPGSKIFRISHLHPNMALLHCMLITGHMIQRWLKLSRLWWYNILYPSLYPGNEVWQIEGMCETYIYIYIYIEREWYIYIHIYIHIYIYTCQCYFDFITSRWYNLFRYTFVFFFSTSYPKMYVFIYLRIQGCTRVAASSGHNDDTGRRYSATLYLYVIMFIMATGATHVTCEHSCTLLAWAPTETCRVQLCERPYCLELLHYYI